MKRAFAHIFIVVITAILSSCKTPDMPLGGGILKFSPEEATLGPEGGVVVSYAKDFTKIWDIIAYVDGELFFKINVTNEDQTIPYSRSVSDYCTIVRPEKERVEVHLPPRSRGDLKIVILGMGYNETEKVELYGGRFVVDQIVEE